MAVGLGSKEFAQIAVSLWYYYMMEILSTGMYIIWKFN
jgi:hypothetical protein